MATKELSDPAELLVVFAARTDANPDAPVGIQAINLVSQPVRITDGGEILFGTRGQPLDIEANSDA